jgi:hypothetical protein
MKWDKKGYFNGCWYKNIAGISKNLKIMLKINAENKKYSLDKLESA